MDRESDRVRKKEGCVEEKREGKISRESNGERKRGRRR